MIFLSLGTNKGDTFANLKQAEQLLEDRNIFTVRTSAYFHTPPWGISEQDWFLNAVIEVRFLGNAQQLLEHVLAIEIDMGRIRTVKNGPRIIDIDILEFHGETHHEENLHIPHPRYTERAFILEPFVDLEPNWVPTSQAQTVSQLLDKVFDERIYKHE